MKTLLLVRHAQAVALDARTPDRDRALSAQGVEQAAKVGHVLLQQQLRIDLMLASAAVRTQQTATILQQALQTRLRSCQIVEALYLASDALLWAVVTQMDPAIETLMIVAHNPGLEMLGRRFVPALDQLPTAGVVEVVFACDKWSEAGEATVQKAQLLV